MGRFDEMKEFDFFFSFIFLTKLHYHFYTKYIINNQSQKGTYQFSM
jgi:hypothetical protein